MKKFLLSLAVPLALALPSFASAQAYYAPVAPESDSITVDVVVSHTASPDVLNLSITCPSHGPLSRDEMRAHFAEREKAIRNLVGEDGIVRKPQTNFYPGTPFYPMVPMMDATGAMMTPPEQTDLVSADFSITVRKLKPTAASRLSVAIQEMNCTPTWDARILFSGKYLRDNLKDLRAQIQEKKAAYEEALGVALDKVIGMYSATSIDPTGFMWPAGGYDADTNTMDVQTTLSITYSLGR